MVRVNKPLSVNPYNSCDPNDGESPFDIALWVMETYTLPYHIREWTNGEGGKICFLWFF